MKWVGEFNLNEISLIFLTSAAYLFVFLAPKKLKREIKLMSILWGITVGIMFDFTIGGGLLDYYRENDTNHYELFDIAYYLLYGPFGYAFMYFYKQLKINRKTFGIYIITWVAIGILSQWMFTLLNIITYQNHYKLAYSVPIFIIIQTVTGLLYEFVSRRYNDTP